MARTKSKRATKASRSAAAKKAAATRRRNANKRSAAGKKAAATRRRNARKGSRKSSSRRPTKAKRSAAAKKAAATRRRNANKRSAAGKKAAATRRRNARKGTRKGSRKSRRKSSPRSTKAKRSAAAKKAWRTRRRNANKRSAAGKKGARKRAAPKRRASSKRRTSSKAKRSAAARKGWRTRRGGRRPARRKASRKGRRKARSHTAVMKQSKNLTDAMMNGVNLLPGAVFAAATAFVAIGAYNAIKPMSWDAIKITGPSGYLARAVSFIPGTPNTSADLQNFAEKSLAIATIGGLAYLVSSKKALGLINTKTAGQAVGLAAFVYGLNFLGEMQTMNLGSAFGALSKGNFQNARNAVSLTGTSGLGMSHTQMPLFGPGGPGSKQNYALVRGSGNMPPVTSQLQTQNTAAIQQGSGASGFFGTRGIGATRVNLF